jgi:hypothetical protein
MFRVFVVFYPLPVAKYSRISTMEPRLSHFYRILHLLASGIALLPCAAM